MIIQSVSTLLIAFDISCNTNHFIDNSVQDPVLRHALNSRDIEHEIEEHDDNHSELGLPRYLRQDPSREDLDALLRARKCNNFTFN